MAGECLVFSLQKLWPPSLILWQRKVREEKKFVRRGRSTRGVGIEDYFSPSPPPPASYPHRPLRLQITHGRSDERTKLITFDRPSETPAQQAEVIQMCKYFLTSISISYWYLAIRFPDCVIEYGSFNEKNKMELGPSGSYLFSFH